MGCLKFPLSWPLPCSPAAQMGPIFSANPTALFPKGWTPPSSSPCRRSSRDDPACTWLFFGLCSALFRSYPHTFSPCWGPLESKRPGLTWTRFIMALFKLPLQKKKKKKKKELLLVSFWVPFHSGSTSLCSQCAQSSGMFQASLRVNTKDFPTLLVEA